MPTPEFLPSGEMHTGRKVAVGGPFRNHCINTTRTLYQPGLRPASASRSDPHGAGQVRQAVHVLPAALNPFYCGGVPPGRQGRGRPYAGGYVQRRTSSAQHMAGGDKRFRYRSTEKKKASSTRAGLPSIPGIVSLPPCGGLGVILPLSAVLSLGRHMAIGPENALIVQSDCSVLLDVHGPRAAEAQAALAPFAALVKSPEHIHTYRFTPLSIWNACASGLAAGQMVAALNEHARYLVPRNVEPEILERAACYGRVVDHARRVLVAVHVLRRCDGGTPVARPRSGTVPGRSHRRHEIPRRSEPARRVETGAYGGGLPAEDLAGYASGEPFHIALRESAGFVLRDYQRQAAEAFYMAGTARGGSGVVVAGEK